MCKMNDEERIYVKTEQSFKCFKEIMSVIEKYRGILETREIVNIFITIMISGYRESYKKPNEFKNTICKIIDEVIENYKDSESK